MEILEYLSHNKLTKLPERICELRHLVNFNVSHNNLNQLPTNFGHLDDLEDLVWKHFNFK